MFCMKFLVHSFYMSLSCNPCYDYCNVIFTYMIHYKAVHYNIFLLTMTRVSPTFRKSIHFFNFLLFTPLVNLLTLHFGALYCFKSLLEFYGNTRRQITAHTILTVKWRHAQPLSDTLHLVSDPHKNRYALRLSPIGVAARSAACTVITLSNAGVQSSNPNQWMDIFLCFYLISFPCGCARCLGLADPPSKDTSEC